MAPFPWDPPLPAEDPVTPDELRYWIQRVHELPAIRPGKVPAAREAIRRGTYERPDVIEEMIDGLAREL